MALNLRSQLGFRAIEHIDRTGFTALGDGDMELINPLSTRWNTSMIRWMVAVETAMRFRIGLSVNGGAYIYWYLNGNANLVADAVYVFDFPASLGDAFNYGFSAAGDVLITRMYEFTTFAD